MNPWSCDTRNCIWEKYFLLSFVRLIETKMTSTSMPILMTLSLQSSLSMTTMMPTMEMRVLITMGSVWLMSMRIVSTSLVIYVMISPWVLPSK